MRDITRLSLLRDVLPAIAHADLMSIPERLVRRGNGIGLVSTHGGSQIVAIGDPELLRHILLLDETPYNSTDRAGEIYDRLRQRGPNGEPGDVLDGGQFSQDDSILWERTKRAARMTNTPEIARSIVEHFTKLLEDQHGEQEINLLELLKESFIHGLALWLFGASMQDVGKTRLASYAPEYFERMAWQLVFSFLPGKKGLGREKYAETGQALGAVFDEMIEAARQDRSQFTGSLLYQLLSEFDVNDAAERQIIKGTLGTEVMAGFDSVGVVVAQACRELARNQPLQTELRDEAVATLESSATASSMWQRLPKTTGLWKLSLHRTPAFKVIFRHVTKEHTLAVKRKGFTTKHTVRRGDQLLLVLSAAHHDPAYWSKENMTLGHTLEGWSNAEKHAHLPFGAGKRQCPGRNLAERTGPRLIATILQHCEITLPLLRLPGVAMAMTSPLRNTTFKVKWL